MSHPKKQSFIDRVSDDPRLLLGAMGVLGAALVLVWLFGLSGFSGFSDKKTEGEEAPWSKAAASDLEARAAARAAAGGARKNSLDLLKTEPMALEGGDAELPAPQTAPARIPQRRKFDLRADEIKTLPPASDDDSEVSELSR